MHLFWEHGAMFVREAVALYSDPKPHFNTVSTMVRTLETKGYLNHKAYGNSHQYHAIVSREEFSKGTLSGVIGKYFENSYLDAVSTLVREEKISVDELQELIKQIKQSNK